MTIPQLRDGLIAVAAYFAACALVSDAHAAFLKDTTMSTTPVITWRTHADQPAAAVEAIIVIRPPTAGGAAQALPELYRWDPSEGYWISASGFLKIRHKEFLWAAIDPILRSSEPDQASAATPRPWPRDEESTANLLGLVGIEVTADAVTYWQDHQVREAEDWAAAVHLRASDNAVAVPPMPMFLRELQGAAS